jgi:hypothetical protein
VLQLFDEADDFERMAFSIGLLRLLIRGKKITKLWTAPAAVDSQTARDSPKVIL